MKDTTINMYFFMILRVFNSTLNICLFNIGSTVKNKAIVKNIFFFKNSVFSFTKTVLGKDDFERSKVNVLYRLTSK